MDLSVQRTQAQGMATELLAETAWRQMLGGMECMGKGVQGELGADWLAQALARELSGHAAGMGATGGMDTSEAGHGD
jgi:Na+/phosphate symporter